MNELDILILSEIGKAYDRLKLAEAVLEPDIKKERHYIFIDPVRHLVNLCDAHIHGQEDFGMALDACCNEESLKVLFRIVDAILNDDNLMDAVQFELLEYYTAMQDEYESIITLMNIYVASKLLSGEGAFNVMQVVEKFLPPDVRV